MAAKFGQQPNQSIIDGIETLQALASSDEPIGTRELARRMGLEPTRVNRLLKTLASLGIAQQLDNKKYVAGPGMHVLAAQSLYASGLLRKAIEPLDELASHYNYVVALGVLWRTSVSYLYHRQPGMSSTDAIGRIGLRNATQSGIGMVLMAALDDDSVLDIYRDEAIPSYPQGQDDLLADLKEIRDNGYSRIVVEAERSVSPDRVHHTIAVSNSAQAQFAIALSGWIPDSLVSSVVGSLQDAVRKIEYN